MTLDDAIITKYNTSARISGVVMRELVSKIQKGELLNVKELCKLGDNMIKLECDKVYKRETVKGISFPTSISLNNCTGNYIYEEDVDLKISVNDVVKIDLGVNIGGSIARLGETIVYNLESDKYIEFLNGLQRDVIKYMKAGMVNDDIKMMIESKCTNMGCFPIENCTSYQHNTELEMDVKYILLNFKKYYDEDDNLVVNPNICFDIEDGDIYTMDLTIIPNNEETGTEHIYTCNTESHIMRYNEFFYNLKLKASREFCSMIKTNHGNNAFNCIEYRKIPKNRVGIKESLEAGILDEYPILYSKDNLPVYHKKFTVIVKGDKTLLLKYN